MMIVTIIFTWHIAAVFATMVGIGTLVWLRVQRSAGSLPMYQMVDTNEPLVTDKNSLEDSHANGKKRIFANGHVPYEKPSNAVIQQMLESDSEVEA